MSTNRPNRDEVEKAIATLKQFLSYADQNVSEYGSVDTITAEEVNDASFLMDGAADVIEVLNDALPGGANG